MEISGLGNSSTTAKSSAVETAENEGENSKQAAGAKDTKSSVSNDSQTSPVPPPNPISESGNEPTRIPTAESNTGGQINVSV